MSALGLAEELAPRIIAYALSEQAEYDTDLVD
jgi:hypothetical protein